jgi:hypothetical protein
VWVIGGIPDLQQVTNAGNTTTVGLIVDNGTESVVIKHDLIKIVNALGVDAIITSPTLTTATEFRIPDKLTTPQTFAMLSDVTGGGLTKATAAGTDTYTATISGVASYTDGDAYLVRFTNGNTTAATLNINSLGAKSLYRNNDGAIIGGDIWAGAEMLCVYNSTLNAFQCIGTSPNSIFAYITNADSVTITKGQVVYAFGGVGDRMTVKLANNTSDATSARTVGVVLSTSIAANQKGIIILQGLLDGLSILPTSTYADGDSIYLGATAGSITNVKPYAPNHLVYVATVTTASNGSAGRMYVRVQNGYEMDELHDVSAQTPANKNGLFYNTSTSLWEARAVAATDIDANVSNTEFGYLDGVTSAIQTQLNAKTDVYAVQCGAAIQATVADSTNYHMGIAVAATLNTTSSIRRFKFTNAGSVKEVSWNLFQSVNGSNETVTLYLRNESTSTDNLIGTFTSDFGANSVLSTLFTGLSITVNTTNDYVFKITTPAFGTNPTNWLPAAIISVQKT